MSFFRSFIYSLTRARSEFALVACGRGGQLAPKTVPAKKPLDATVLEDRVMFSATPLANLAPAQNGFDELDGSPDASFDNLFTSPDEQTTSLSSSDELDTAWGDGARSFEGEASKADTQEARREIVFIDTAADDYQQLVDNLVSQQDDERFFEIVLLDSDRDGIEQISEVLAGYDDVDAVHIVSHGTNGAVKLGNGWLRMNNLDGYAGQLVGWRDALADDADLLFYGCDVAGSDDGQSLIQSLAALCDCDVAASIDDTGHASRGGDWELEYVFGPNQGRVETDTAFSIDVQQNWSHSLAVATFQQGVNSYAQAEDTELTSGEPDTGQGSNQSITVDLSDGGDETHGLILFDNIFGSGPNQIPLGSTINSASLTFYVVSQANSGDNISLHRMLTSWDENSTWNSMTNGITADGVEASATADAILANPDDTGFVTFDGLESTLQDWSNGESNFGWAILTDSTNGWDFDTSEETTVSRRPQLIIDYTAPVAPTISLPGGAVDYTENDSATIIDGGATLSDPDSSDFDTETLTVDITAGGGASDRLGIYNQGVGIGEIGVSGSNVTYNFGAGAVTIGTFSGGASGSDPLIITLNANSDVTSVEALMRNITYENVSENPNTAARSVRFVLTDPYAGASNEATKTINVAAVNDSPTISANTGTTVSENSTANTIAAAMLDEGDPDDSDVGLTYTVTSATTSGTLRLSGAAIGLNDTFTQDDIDNNRVTYDHDGSETFSDSFDFSLTDGGEDGSTPATGTFYITITPVNDNDPVAADDSFTVDEGASFDTTASDLLDSGFASVLGNDTDADLPNDSLTVSLDTDVSFGALTLNADGTFSYVHDGSETFTDSFTYIVSDANGGVSDTGTVTITITPVNDNDPAAVDDSFTLNQGATFDTTASDLLGSGFASVLGNDTDADLPNDTLTVTLDADVSFGALTLNADGTFSYVHDGSENFTDSFSYIVSDANGGVNDTGTVTITITPVNDNDPVAVDDSFTLSEGATFDTTASDLLDSGFASVLGNDTDADLPNDALTVTLDADVSFGALTLNADGTFSYLHDGSENFTDSFTYIVSDANGGVNDTGTVTITVTPVNDNNPVATNDNFTVNEGAAFDTTGSDLLDSGFAAVLGNDTDADLPNDTLTVTLDTDVSFGALTFNADGTFSYLHDGSENFTDSFTYTVSDANGGVNDTGTVTITVTPINDNDPVAADDSFAVNEGATFDTTGSDLLDSGFASVLGNDSDADLPNDALTVSLATDVSFGALTLNADGTFSYIHDGSENFTDSFTYIVSDANVGVNDTGSLTITITPVNDNHPVAADDSFTVNEGATFNTTASDLLDSGFASVLGNDTDADLPHDSLTVTLDTDVSFGALTLNADGTFSYVHDGSENFTDSFTYIVSDANGGVNDTGNVIITVTPINDAPQATGDSYFVNEDTLLAVTLADSVLANDTDAENDPLTVTLVSGAVNGSLNVNADGSFDYLPNANFHGADSFVYRIDDGQGGVQTATAVITIQSVNDAPVAGGENFIVARNETLSIAAPGLLLNDTDVEGDSLSVSLVTGPAEGTLQLQADGSFTYTPDPNAGGVVSFVYEVSDGAAASNSVTVVMNVKNVLGFPSLLSQDEVSSESEQTPSNNESPAENEPEGETEESVEATSSTANSAADASNRFGRSKTGLGNPADQQDQAEETQLAPAPNSILVAAASEESTPFFETMESNMSTAARKAARVLSQTTTQVAAHVDTQMFWGKLDEFQEGFESNYDSFKLAVGGAAIASVALTVGYVFWTIKGGYLVASMLASLPAWRLVDPLPIFDSALIGSSPGPIRGWDEEDASAPVPSRDKTQR